MKSVVHEIRNHLAVAVANVEAFRDGVLEPSPARLAAVLQALHEAEVLLRDVPSGTATAHLEVATQPIDICTVITNEVLGLEALAKERGVGFGVRQCSVCEASCSAFACDPVCIGEIVNNIVSNAIRYTPPGGRVDVECRNVRGDIVLNTTDDGPGIDRKDAVRIFESGYRGNASRDTPGSGMGLALAKRFAEEHGGSIAAHNVEGRGAQFTIRLPSTVARAVAQDGRPHSVETSFPKLPTLFASAVYALGDEPNAQRSSEEKIT